MRAASNGDPSGFLTADNQLLLSLASKEPEAQSEAQSEAVRQSHTGMDGARGDLGHGWSEGRFGAWLERGEIWGENCSELRMLALVRV